MKAVVYSEYGGPEVLRLADVDKPAPAANEILVKVHAASLNPADWHFMRGTPYPIRFGRGLTRPKSVQRLGFDYSGVVEGVGGNVTEFAVGDPVFGAARGACAEYVAVPVDPAGGVRKPARLTFEEAAGVLIAGLTALQALRDKAQVQRGHHVLINGASGGVGTFAVQIAKAFGAEVTGVQSTSSVELVRSLGADHVIDYTQDDFTTRTRRYDIVLDNVGNRSLSEVRRVLKPGGTYLPNGGGSPANPMPISRIVRTLAISPFISHRIKFFVASPKKDDLQTLADLMETGKVTPVVDRCYSPSEAAEGMRYLESGHARGKIVVTFA